MAHSHLPDYWRRMFECPFYQTNWIDMIECEAGYISFDTREGIRKFMDLACDSNYLDCPIYKAKMIDYDVKEREERDKRRADKKLGETDRIVGEKKCGVRREQD